MYSLEQWVRYGDEIRRPFHVNPNLPKSTRIVIVGGGLSGLSTAFLIARKRQDVSIEIIEKEKRLGGVIDTWRSDEWCCDVAVNATRPHPSVWRLVKYLGLEKEFSQSRPEARKRWIHDGNQARRLSPISALKIGPIRLARSVKKARKGGRSVMDLIPDKEVADALTLGVVNDVAINVDADFLFPTLTRFGAKPPKRWSGIKKEMMRTFPIFTPTKNSMSSFEGGMSTLTEKMITLLMQMSNVNISLNTRFKTPSEAANHFNVEQSSVIWTAPLDVREPDNKISVFAVGYNESDVESVETGYGTLIPNSDIPVSGILHESDIHSSRRAPDGFRLFRIMAPHSRWDGEQAEIRKSAKQFLSDRDPVIFELIGVRSIPAYRPGYMERISNKNPNYSRLGWNFSGVSITHVICEAERVSDLF